MQLTDRPLFLHIVQLEVFPASEHSRQTVSPISATELAWITGLKRERVECVRRQRTIQKVVSTPGIITCNSRAEAPDTTEREKLKHSFPMIKLNLF